MDSKQLTSLLSGKSLSAAQTKGKTSSLSSPMQVPDLLGKTLGQKKPTSTPPQPPPFPSKTAWTGLTTAATSPQGPLLPQAQQTRTQKTVLPLFAQLASQMMSELLEKPMTLMQVNRSRRGMIAQYLELLAEGAGGASKKHHDPNVWLQNWIEGPRTSAQNLALLTYFEELSLFYLAQTLLLKAWSDRGIRRWKFEDLGSINYHLSQALLVFLKPGSCERWNITTQNLYSWYNPSSYLQQDVWKKVEHIKLTEEGPQIILDLLFGIRRHQPEWPELKHYDSRFYNSLWKGAHTTGFDPSENSTPIPRKKIAFSPTLRDGTLVRTAPEELQWIGTECIAFQFYAAEFAKLWWGPSSPPLWTTGNGLDVHSREQLSLGFSGAAVPIKNTAPLLSPIVAKIGEIEACDIGFVVEEHPIRLNQKSGEALRFKENVDELEYFKRLRAHSTSLGSLQAAVALTKLRPGGCLWWTREEPLSKVEGDHLLSHLLEKAKFLAEWDLSGVDHSLPSSGALFPKYIYLFQREPSIDARHVNRPVRIIVRGQIRSHIEVPVLLESSFQTLHSKLSTSQYHWQIHRQESPTLQRDWLQKWPEPTEHTTLNIVENLRTHSDPLASIATIQMPSNQRTPLGATLPVPPVPSFVLKNAVWIRMQKNQDGCGLCVTPTFNHPPQEKDAILVRFPDSHWIAPMRYFLESDLMKTWLNHHTEKKNEKWMLTESILKYLPIPRWIIEAIKKFQPQDSDEWTHKIQSTPMKVMDAVRQQSNELSSRGQVYVLSSKLLQEAELQLSTLAGMLGSDGKIVWRAILAQVMPGTEFVPASLHSGVRIQGNLPPHIPIGRFERVKTPSPGILLMTESGHTLYLFSDKPRILDMLESLMENVLHPTWGELVDYLRLPKTLDSAESTARSILKSHGELLDQQKQLKHVIQQCIQLSIS